MENTYKIYSKRKIPLGNVSKVNWKYLKRYILGEKIHLKISVKLIGNTYKIEIK